MSFNIGLSGLAAASEEINITGNNIANASSIGFKQSRAEFGDVYAASVLGGNVNQAGAGVSLLDISQDFSQGSVSFTGNVLDMAINGEGFFVLNGDSGTVYSRAGAFGTDSNGYVVNSSGENLQGFAPSPNGEASGGGALTDLVVSTGEIEPKPTAEVNSIINVDAAATPSSIIGSNLATNGGTSGAPVLGVQTARAAELNGQISTAGTDFSGTTAAKSTGAFNIAGGLDFAAAGGAQGFSVSVNGGAFTAIDLSSADTADEAELIAHVETQLAAAGLAGQVDVSSENSRLVLTTAASGDNANITFGLVNGLAQSIVTPGLSVNGKTAPPSGFKLTLDDASRDIVLNQDFSNSGPAALALGGGPGSGNEALEDNIQAQIDDDPSLAGRITVAINGDGEINFRATQAGAQNLKIDPGLSAPGSVNFDQMVSFSSNRRAGQLDVDKLNFTNGTSFTLTVGDVSEKIELNDDYSIGSSAAGVLGDFPESGLEALEDKIQSLINDSDLPGDVVVSIGAGGELVFEITDSNESSLQVSSDSTTAAAIGSVDVRNGFDFSAENYTFTIAYSVDGAPAVTSAPITLSENYGSGIDLVNSLQNAINTDANFQFSPGNEGVVARIDPATGFLHIETAEAGPVSTIDVNVTAPAAPAVVQNTGGVVNGTGPAIDFNSFATLFGSETDSTGVDALNNGFGSEVIEVLDSNNKIQRVTIPEGASANSVAALFSEVNGITATAKSTAYITATNRGDPENLGAFQDNSVSNLPLHFAINGTNFESAEGSQMERFEDLAAQINNSTGNLSARVVKDANDNDVLEVTELIGQDLVFSGGNNGHGSMTVQGSVRDATTGEPRISNRVADVQQIADLGNLSQDAIIVGGIVDFTLEEGVILSDAAVDEEGVAIPAGNSSIFGDISDPSSLNGNSFELNTFDPDDSDTYYRSTAMAIYDSVGNQHTLSQYFVKERQDNGVDVDGGVWSVYFQIDGEDVGYNPANPDEPSLARATVHFDQNGRFDSSNEPIYITNWIPRDADGNITSTAAGPAPGDISSINEITNSNFEIDLSEMTQFGGDFAVNSNTQDGYTKGQLVGLDINGNGLMYARFSNGQSQVLGEVALADFANPDGLANIGGTRFAATADSGAATPTVAGSAGLGAIQSGALEDSNVDLSDQLVKMIISQRNFQASAQIIEAADSTTQTILNL